MTSKTMHVCLGCDINAGCYIKLTEMRLIQSLVRLTTLLKSFSLVHCGPLFTRVVVLYSACINREKSVVLSILILRSP